MKNAPRKPMVSAIIAILVLISPIYAESASNLEKYLDCSSEKKIDIVFVFDTTNSMGGEISELRATANKFATDLEASNIDYQLGLVEFRDFPDTCDGFSCGSPGDFAYSVKGNGTLTSEIGTFSSWIKELKAGGGGSPGPEAVLAALRHAGSDLTWRSDAEKAIIVLTDAGAHPDGSCCNAEGDTLEGTIFELVDIGARAYIIGPEDASLEEIAENTGGQLYEIRSGLSLKPLLEEITKSLGCSFRTDVETSCENNQLDVSVQLIGKETIRYISGQTEAWMYLDQAGSISRFNLSYDQETEAYLGSVPDVCGPVEITVYGRVGERSAVQTVQVECGTCGAEAAEERGTLSISGSVFNDSNGDGVKGTDEAGLEGWAILLLKPDGSSIAQESDRNGYYIFTGLIPGSYKVVANARDNWTATAPETGAKDVELIDVHESEIDFWFKSTLAHQPPPVTEVSAKSWLRSFGPSAQSVQQTIDGGYIITTIEGLLKYDADGNMLWSKYNFVFNGSYLDLRFSDGQQTSDGGCVMTGDLEPIRNDLKIHDRDILLLKTDEGGNQVWSKEFGRERISEEGRSVKQCLDGGYIITGQKSDLKSHDLCLIKTDADGNLLWERTYGGDYQDEGRSVQQTTDGGYIITGLFGFASSGNIYDFVHLWLLKTDADGNLLWNRTYDSDMVESEGQSVQQTIDGGFIITGRRGQDVRLIKTDSSGDILWDRSFDGRETCEGNSVQQTSDGGYIITGYKGGFTGNDADIDLWLIKTDADGNLLWDKTFGSRFKGVSVQQTTDGGYIIVGSLYQMYNDEFQLIKTDKNGDVNDD